MTQVEPYGIIAVNSFAKEMHIVPMKLKAANADWNPAMQQIIEQLRKPKVIYTDLDASVLSKALGKWFADSGIKDVVTRQHAAIAERAIRTIKKEVRRQAKRRQGIPRRIRRKLLDSTHRRGC